MSLKACSALVLSFGCLATLGCGEEAANKPAAAAGASSGGSKGDAGSSSIGKGGHAPSNGGSAGTGTAAGQSGGGSKNGGAGGSSGEAPAPTDGCNVQSKPATCKQTVDVDWTDRAPLA